MLAEVTGTSQALDPMLFPFPCPQASSCLSRSVSTILHSPAEMPPAQMAGRILMGIGLTLAVVRGSLLSKREGLVPLCRQWGWDWAGSICSGDRWLQGTLIQSWDKQRVRLCPRVSPSLRDQRQVGDCLWDLCSCPLWLGALVGALESPHNCGCWWGLQARGRCGGIK